MLVDVGRDISSIRFPRWGQVLEHEGVVPWLVVDDEGQLVEPVRRYLTAFVAGQNSRGSVRSYAYTLLRWWRWLRAIDVPWDRATTAEGRDLVLWMQQADKLQNSPRTNSATTVGTINPITCKSHRRAQRPEVEYREPTEEWREFRQHFQMRELELGQPRNADHHHPITSSDYVSRLAGKAAASPPSPPCPRPR